MVKTMDNDMITVEELPVYVLPRCIVQFLNTVDRNGDADGKIKYYKFYVMYMLLVLGEKVYTILILFSTVILSII